MPTRFEAYGETQVGRELAEIIDAPELVAEYRVMSAMDRPAVQAIAPHVADIINALPTARQRHSANQFCGWRVGQVMRGLGYRLVRDRGRVVDAPFKTGAVWGRPDGEVKVVHSLPEGITRRIDMHVKQRAGGDIVGKWCAVQTGRDPARKIHTFVENPKALAVAVESARAYAKKWDFGYILILDPENLASGFVWPRAA